MTLDDFTDLAFRRLENPSDSAVRIALDAALAEHPEWVGDWHALRDFHARFAEVLPIAVELNTPAPNPDDVPPVPWSKLAAKPTAPASAPPTRTRWKVRWIWLAPLVTAASILLVWNLNPTPHVSESWPAPSAIAATADLDPSLASALRTPVSELLATLQPITLRDSHTHPAAWIQQPFGAARAGHVVIAWTGGPAHLILRQRGHVVWQALQATSPTETDPLPADTIYELSVSLVAPDHPDLVTRFITVADPVETNADFGPFSAIVAALTSSPARLGEAAAGWRSLNEIERTSPTGIRLGLWLGINAHQPDIWHEAKSVAADLP